MGSLDAPRATALRHDIRRFPEAHACTTVGSSGRDGATSITARPHSSNGHWMFETDARQTPLVTCHRRRWTSPCRRGVVGSVALVTALTLTGCATPSGAATTAVPAAPTPTPTQTSSERETVTDAETCSAIGDVLSITFNTELAVRQERMSSHEQEGWYRLATRVLDRVPTRGEGPVSEAVAALREVAPPLELAAYGTAAVGSDEWNAVTARAHEACADAGSEIATTSFTGG